MKKCTLFVFLLCAFLSVLVFYSFLGNEDTEVKCPEYKTYSEKNKFILGAGSSDNPEFIDCGGNLLIEKRREVFVPKPNYPYVVANFTKKYSGQWLEAIIYLDKENRFIFKDKRLYIYSNYDRPTYYILNNLTGIIEKEYHDLNSVDETEKSIFQKLSQ